MSHNSKKFKISLDGAAGANGYSGDVTTRDFAYRNDPKTTEGVQVDANGYATVNKFKWCPGSVTWSATRTNKKGLNTGVSGQPQVKAAPMPPWLGQRHPLRPVLLQVEYSYTALPKSGLIPQNKLAGAQAMMAPVVQSAT